MITAIVLIPNGYANALQVCEAMENKHFNNFKAVSKHIDEKLHLIGDIRSFQVHTMAEFIQAFNKGEIKDLERYFISYVQLG